MRSGTGCCCCCCYCCCCRLSFAGMERGPTQTSSFYTRLSSVTPALRPSFLLQQMWILGDIRSGSRLHYNITNRASRPNDRWCAEQQMCRPSLLRQHTFPRSTTTTCR
uniref:Putative secreted protein n=1 Tax=Anopheles marajoara TaxID=58244 RepID=A0A2M4C841_9DIPT